MHSFSPVCLCFFASFYQFSLSNIRLYLTKLSIRSAGRNCSLLWIFLQLPAKCQVPVTLTQGALSVLTVTLPAKECKAAEPLKNRFMSMIH